MKKLFLLICLVCYGIIYSFGEVRYFTLKKGEMYTLDNISTVSGAVVPTYVEITGNAIAVEYTPNSAYVKIHAIAAGDGTFQYKFLGNSSSSPTIYVFHVIDVVGIEIEDNVTMTVGEQFTYHPIITDRAASTTLTWTSSNTSVASAASNGVITANGIGKATITCTAANGVATHSLVTVSPRLAQELTLDKQNIEMAIGETAQLQATVLPTNVTSSKVKWLSSNENVAQVDENGNITAINYGYCSILAIADDGSSKFSQCLVYVPGTKKQGDINEDGSVDVNDVTRLVKIIQGVE